ncbi:class I SAM-dependent methyltransferase [Arcanobacterium pinnipediorum]|uniref:Class I SAM-dependent methyltransferase n=1 Tax=Arcanobacterium pinnipediorum TaxID=1503041 RepID=A0ABY5AI02_9ACTO|nr:class I SAM-dependent methyltransferase [Arcanobacterium pinnipediorum]USR79839.1 class I SAM-dependent methyltransferase [Arcanobacterium pinnipediorum]
MTWDQRYRAAIETGQKLFSDEPALLVVQALDSMSGQPQDSHSQPLLAIDVGAGEGRHSKELARRGYSVIALESAQSLVEHHRQTPQNHSHIGKETDISSRIDWTFGDVRTYMPSQLVDLVLVAYLHQPEFSLPQQLANIDTWIKPGGQIVLVGHSRKQAGRDVGGPPDPKTLWDVAELRAELHRLGYFISRAEDVERTDVERRSDAGRRDKPVDAIIVAQKHD